MYEMFCDHAQGGSSIGGNPTNLKLIEGLIPISVNDGIRAYSITSDAKYVYIAHHAGKGLTVLNKGSTSDPLSWTIVDTPQLDGVSNYGTLHFPNVVVDDQYVYVTVYHSPGWVVLEKETWVIQDTPIISGSGAGDIHVDDNYVYTCGEQSNYWYIFEKYTWNPVGDRIREDGVMRTITSDDQYVYVGYKGGSGLTVYNKSDMSVVPGTPDIGVQSFGSTVDDEYLYLGHRGGKTLTVVRKSDWSVVEETPDLGGASLSGRTAPDVYVDDTYLYVAYDGGFAVIRKSDWTLLQGIVELPTRGVGVHADDKYVYVAYADDQGYAILGLPD